MADIALEDVFGKRTLLPNSEADERLARLVGIDNEADRLAGVLSTLIFPSRMRQWQDEYHPDAKELFAYLERRHPLVVLAGDVGTGKTELAETIGSRVAREGGVEITLFPMSLSSRGTGLVGQMTNLITSAFDHVREAGRKITKTKDGDFKEGIILLIDEADALAQSREEGQMHHEDRAGVNALIRGIDLLNQARLPAAVIMCTNRASSMDPAVMRRAAEVFSFDRPDEEQRFQLLQPVLAELGFEEKQIRDIAQMTGASEGCDYGFTYSDITQRLFPTIAMSAYPDRPISYDSVIQELQAIRPTPPFQASAGT